MKNIIEKFSKYSIYFIVFAFIGWVYEVLLELLIYNNGFVNRGVLFGPYLPVYGFGALIFIFCLRKIRDKKIKIGKINISPLLVFIGITLIATSMELFTTYLMDFIGADWKALWDYSIDYKYHFQGRIALDTSLRFGVGGMAFMYLIEPWLDKLCTKIGMKNTKIISVIICAILLCDCIYTFLIK